MIGGSLRWRDGGAVHGSSSPSSCGGRRTPRTRPRRSASWTIPSTCARPILRTLARNAHWSAHGTRWSSRKTLLPCSRGLFCNGKAMRFPNPPCGIVSWLGKRRSYESSPMSGRLSIVSVRRCDPSRRASAAGMASSKKSQTCAASSGARLFEGGRKTQPAARVRERPQHLRCHPALSKSTARKKHVSSRSSG